MNAKSVAKLIGLSVLLIGVGGLILGEKSLLGILNIDFEEDIIHLASGSLLLIVGLKATNKTAGLILGVVGLTYLVIGILSFVTPELFGFLHHGYSIVDNLIHVSLGVIGLVAYVLSRKDNNQSTT